MRHRQVQQVTRARMCMSVCMCVCVCVCVKYTRRNVTDMKHCERASMIEEGVTAQVLVAEKRAHACVCEGV